MEKAYFMGIDTGTNSSKGVLIDESGSVICEHATDHEMTNPAPGHYEHDAVKDWWGDFCIISKALIKKSGTKPSDIKAVGLSALGADCLPVDENCRPLRKAILYGIDARATDEMAQLTEMYGEEQIRKWYGRPLCSSDVMPKILWIKNKEPEVYAKTHKFLTGSSFIAAKLTENYVVDRFLGLASFNPLYFNDGTPNPETCAPICRPDQLAQVREANDIAGYVTGTAARETGLAAGTPVIVGTDDSGAEAISTGVVAPGKMMIQFGSSIYMILGTKNLVDDERLWREEFIVPGLCDISAGTNTAGSLTKWYRDNFFADAMDSEKAGGPDAYQTMMLGIDEIAPGSGGLITLPYFAGERTPINDPKAKGILFGLTLGHTRRHMYRSALESIGYSVNQQLMLMLNHNIPIDQIFAVGGGVKNELWMQIVADIIGRELSTPAITVGASFGDALMAASGIKYPGFESFAELTNFIKPGKTYIPNIENHEAYKKYQAIYDALYPVTADLMHQLDNTCL
ncbi:MAG TPA: carbohydrate kinase [Lachnospiraceae bacterium]|jgi:xylulokinase|uniref:Xylulokinase n=1 Tax=Muricomes intestini TaxID=1796634 RepID=A0A4V2URZ3_9FIRM|nr:FGGY-family carbohydrate kinase [Muricomes intestini]TCS79422.1 xylulokinase [Muricomes intestini]HCR84017.1 carbohydrate kinase [Lachnospiraceae bacterium]